MVHGVDVHLGSKTAAAKYSSSYLGLSSNM